MLDKSPENYTLVTYLWLIFLSTFGGLIKFLRRVKGDRTGWRFTLDILIAAFCGIVAFFLCEGLGADRMTSHAISGIAGNLGSQSLDVFKQMFKELFGTDKGV